MSEADVHCLPFLEGFNRFVEDLKSGHLSPEERNRRKLEVHDLAVDCIEGFRAEHRRGWGHDLVLWALKLGGRVEPPPPTPGWYILHTLRVEYPEAIRAYERFVRKVSEGAQEPSTDEWLLSPWKGVDP